MPETIIDGFIRLFTVRILHHYWLDEDSTMFDSLTDAGKKDRYLADYDFRRFLDVSPMPSTEKLFQSFGCIYKVTPSGFTVLARAGRVIPVDSQFEFAIVVTDSSFYNYTSLTLNSGKTYSFHREEDNQTYVYREGVFVLSNLSGTAVILDGNTTTSLFLSANYVLAAGGEAIESMVHSGANIIQYTSDDNQTQPVILSDGTSTIPVFVNQEDAPKIVPPSGITGAPERGVLLTSGMPEDLFATIQLVPIASDASFNFTDSDGAPMAKGPVYEIRFKNRSTFRRYKNQQTGVINTPAPLVALPLTAHYPMESIAQDTNRRPALDNPIRVEKPDGTHAQLISEIIV